MLDVVIKPGNKRGIDFPQFMDALPNTNHDGWLIKNSAYMHIYDMLSNF